MTYGLTATSVPATPKQITFLNSLIAERDTESINIDGDVRETIMNVLGEIFVTKVEASAAITALLKQPKVTAAAKIEAPKIAGVLEGIPCSKYVVDHDGKVIFLEIAEWKGTRYLRELLGSPGAWNKIKPVGARRAALAHAIKAAGPAAAAKRYADLYTVCAVCSSPLSDETSRELGLGPICRQRF